MEQIRYKDKSLILEDGVKLTSRIWLPNKEGPWPALLMRQPYGREIASTVTYIHPSYFAKHGFLVIVQDVRGQGSSEGQFLGFEQEAADTSKTHQWVRDLPECNGLLGTYGFSYQGLTQLLALPGTTPPDCLAPAMTGLNENNHWSCEGGAFWWHIGLSWGLQLAAQRVKRLGDKQGWIEIRKSLENGSYLREGPELLEKYDPQGMAMRWLIKSGQSSNPNNWAVHEPLKDWLTKPMLLIGGWWDPHLVGILDIYQKALEVGGRPELHIGPATHLQWWEGTESLLLNFFKCHLKKEDKLKPSSHSPNLWNLTTQKWEHSGHHKQFIPKWGLITTGKACVNSNDGILESESKSSGQIVLVHDPWRPFPATGGHLSPSPGEVDRSDLDKRFDVATFTTSPLSKLMRLEGIPIIELEASSDNKGFDIYIALSIVNNKQTKVAQVSTGFLRIVGDEAMETKKRKIILQPFLADIKKGSSLRLSIAGSAWPAIGINPGQEKFSCGAPNSDCLVTTISLNISKSKLYISPFLDQKHQEVGRAV